MTPAKPRRSLGEGGRCGVIAVVLLPARCSSRGPGIRSTKNSRSLPFAASRRAAFHSCPPAFSTIAASRIPMRVGLAGAVTGSELPAYRRDQPGVRRLDRVAHLSPGRAFVASQCGISRFVAGDDISSVLGHGDQRPVLCAVSRGVSGRPACIEHLAHHVHPAHPGHHRCSQRLGALDPRAGVPLRRGSRVLLDHVTRRPSTMAARDDCGWSRSAGRPGRDFRAALLRAEQRRNDGAAILPVAGVEPVRAARGSPVHDPSRRDGDCVDRGSCPRAAGVGDCVVVVGDDPDLLDRAGDQHRAAVARVGGGDCRRGLAVSARHVLAHRRHHAADAAVGDRRSRRRVSRGWVATGRVANASCTCCGSAGCCGSA